MSKFQIGDLCITQNTNVGLINDGLLVVILDIDPAHFGGTSPYLIRRIDGQPFPSTISPRGGIPSFYSKYWAWSAGHKLHKIDPDENTASSKKNQRLTEPACSLCHPG